MKTISKCAMHFRNLSFFSQRERCKLQRLHRIVLKCLPCILIKNYVNFASLLKRQFARYYLQTKIKKNVGSFRNF